MYKLIASGEGAIPCFQSPSWVQENDIFESTAIDSVNPLPEHLRPVEP